MAINFPTSPATGDTYSFGGKKWVFNGTGWAIDASAGGTTSQYWRGDKSWQDIGAILPPGYIDGLGMQYVGPAAVTIKSGAAYIPSVGKVVRNDSDMALSGLSLTASSWNHIYVYPNSGVLAPEISTTAPASPYNGTARTKTGDTSRRYVGSVYVGSGGAIYNFRMVGSRFFYQEAETALRVLSNGTSTTEASLSLSGRVPVASVVALLRVDNNSSTQYVHFGNSVDSASGPPSGSITSSRPQQIATFEFPLDDSQTLTYWFPAATTSGVYVSVLGYTFER